MVFLAFYKYLDCCYQQTLFSHCFYYSPPLIIIFFLIDKKNKYIDFCFKYILNYNKKHIFSIDFHSKETSFNKSFSN